MDESNFFFFLLFFASKVADHTARDLVLPYQPTHATSEHCNLLASSSIMVCGSQI